MDDKAPDAFRTISEVADELDLPQHVLRFWESRFREIKPMKRGGGRRYYRPDDIDLLRGIRHLLYGEGYTIRGVQRILREQGIKFVQIVWEEGATQPPHGAREASEPAEDEAVEIEAAESADALEEPRGLGGRLGALIGRDFGEREPPGERCEPPLESTPMPRIEPADRAMHGVVAPEAREPQSPPMEPAPPRTALASEHRHTLRGALHELAECRKLIDAALERSP